MTITPVHPLGCGCCAGVDAATPTTVDNAAGQLALAVRVGTAASFLAAMQGASESDPRLAGLRARQLDDPTVAVMDVWLLVLDVLTFYNERIANEGYLRTATESASLVALARTVGYERGPGRAATAWLSFTIDEGGTLPPSVPVPTATQVASNPGPGEVPQTFETTDIIDARPEWNAMTATTAVRRGPATGDTAVYLPGTVTDLRPGDVVLFVGPAAPGQLPAGNWTTRPISEVVTLPIAGVTRVSWATPLPGSLPAPTDLTVHVMRQRAALFGYNAVDWRTVADEIRDHYRTLRARRAIASTPGKEPGKFELPADDEWPGFDVISPVAKTIDLDADYPKLAPGSWLLIAAAGSTLLFRVASVASHGQADFGLSAKTTRVVLDRTVPTTLNGTRRTALVLTQSEQLDLAPIPIDDPVLGDTIDVDDTAPTLSPGRAVIVTGRTPRLRITDGTFTLALKKGSGATLPLHPGDELEVVASFEAHAGDVRTWPVALGGDVGTIDATSTQVELLPPAPDQVVLTELAEIAVPSTTGSSAPLGSTRLRLVAKLQGCFDRRSVRVLGNVAQATHGESKHEILGSGDATATFQRFVLAQAPLTYAPAATASGVASSLAVVVDGLRWHEVPSLDDAGPSDRVYVVQFADDGKVTVQFGDGAHGARLPTGAQNVVADYRVGTGLPGKLDAGRLTLLTSRPLGVRSVTNPLPTGLAADPDPPETLRQNAPGATLLVDRIVSIVDYEEFARQRPGIAKANARNLRRDDVDVVHLSVAGDAGQIVDGATCADVQAAALAAGDRRRTVVVEPAGVLTFDTALTLFVDPDRDATTVRAAAIGAVLTGFGFDARALGQPVTAGEVMAAAQAVDGVVAVTVRKLFLSGAPAGLSPFLASALATSNGSTVTPAQLLVIRADGLEVVAA